MVINVFKENNNITENNITREGDDDNSEVKRIKSLLDMSNLKYVSDNIKY